MSTCQLVFIKKTDIFALSSPQKTYQRGVDIMGECC